MSTTTTSTTTTERPAPLRRARLTLTGAAALAAAGIGLITSCGTDTPEPPSQPAAQRPHQDRADEAAQRPQWRHDAELMPSGWPATQAVRDGADAATKAPTASAGSRDRNDTPCPDGHSACSTAANLTARSTAGGKVTFR